MTLETIIAENFKTPKGVNRKIEPTRIKYKGEFIALHSGKTIWNRPSHAKLALLNHIKDSIHSYNYMRKIPDRITCDASKLMDELIETKTIELIPV